MCVVIIIVVMLYASTRVGGSHFTGIIVFVATYLVKFEMLWKLIEPKA